MYNVSQIYRILIKAIELFIGKPKCIKCEQRQDGSIVYQNGYKYDKKGYLSIKEPRSNGRKVANTLKIYDALCGVYVLHLLKLS